MLFFALGLAQAADLDYLSWSCTADALPQVPGPLDLAQADVVESPPLGEVWVVTPTGTRKLSTGRATVLPALAIHPDATTRQIAAAIAETGERVFHVHILYSPGRELEPSPAFDHKESVEALAGQLEQRLLSERSNAWRDHLDAAVGSCAQGFEWLKKSSRGAACDPVRFAAALEGCDNRDALLATWVALRTPPRPSGQPVVAFQRLVRADAVVPFPADDTKWRDLAPIIATDKHAIWFGEPQTIPEVGGRIGPQPPGTRVHHTQAVVEKRVEPVFPDEARQQGLGRTRCDVLVRVYNTGRAEELSFVSCPAVFQKSVRAALEQWRWQTKVIDGRVAHFEFVTPVVLEP